MSSSTISSKYPALVPCSATGSGLRMYPDVRTLANPQHTLRFEGGEGESEISLPHIAGVSPEVFQSRSRANAPMVGNKIGKMKILEREEMEKLKFLTSKS